MRIKFTVTVDVSAEQDHIFDLEDRKEIKDAITDAIDQRYQNGFDLAGCYVDGFSVTQEGFTV